MLKIALAIELSRNISLSSKRLQKESNAVTISEMFMLNSIHQLKYIIVYLVHDWITVAVEVKAKIIFEFIGMESLVSKFQ